jgi:hypothetical protein
MVKSVVALLLMVLELAAQGQSPQLVTLGVSADAVHLRLGAPRSYYSNGRYYSHVPSLSSYPVMEVYERKLNGHLFEIRVNYTADESESRLHPSLQVEQLFLESDRPLPARQLLEDINSLVGVCIRRCEVKRDYFMLDMYGDNGIDVTLTSISVSSNEPVAIVALDDVATSATVERHGAAGERLRTGRVLLDYFVQGQSTP